MNVQSLNIMFFILFEMKTIIIMTIFLLNSKELPHLESEKFEKDIYYQIAP
jgi:hypothetical protein